MKDQLKLKFIFSKAGQQNYKILYNTPCLDNEKSLKRQTSGKKFSMSRKKRI